MVLAFGHSLSYCLVPLYSPWLSLPEIIMFSFLWLPPCYTVRSTLYILHGLLMSSHFGETTNIPLGHTCVLRSLLHSHGILSPLGLHTRNILSTFFFSSHILFLNLNLYVMSYYFAMCVCGNCHWNHPT